VLGLRAFFGVASRLDADLAASNPAIEAAPRYSACPRRTRKQREQKGGREKSLRRVCVFS